MCVISKSFFFPRMKVLAPYGIDDGSSQSVSTGVASSVSGASEGAS